MKNKHFTALLGLLIVLVLVGMTMGLISAQEFGSNWSGQYYNNATLSGDPAITSIDTAINFNWGVNSPFPGFVDADNFSVRWTGNQTFADGVYEFSAGRDDAVRVFVDGVMIIDAWGTGPFQTFTAQATLTSGSHQVVVEYADLTGEAAVQVQWQLVGAAAATGTTGPTLTPSQTALPAIPAGAITATVIRAAVLNVRDAPSLGGNRLGRIRRGETYAIIGRDPNAIWFLLQLGGYSGWAYGYYLFIDGNEFTPPVASSNIMLLPGGFVDTGVMAQALAGMNMRVAPDADSTRNGRITWGAFVPVVGRTQNSVWWQIVWKNTVGWAYSPFFRVISGDLANVPIVSPP